VSYIFSNTVSIDNSNSAPITNTSPLPVTLGSNTITINGNINVGPQINVYNSNGTAITNSAPLPTMLVGNVTGNINGITTTVTVHQDPTSNLAINNLPGSTGGAANVVCTWNLIEQL